MIPEASERHEANKSKLSAFSVSGQEFEDFIYLISHDVRNSVRALIEVPQWILEDLEAAGVCVDGSIADSINLMNVHTGRLDRMLVDLLTFSRVGRMQQTREIDLDAALSEVMDVLPMPPGFEVSRSLETPRVSMGERDILTLLSALLSNAFKHHDRKSGQIIVSSWQDERYLSLSVCDDGPGIPAKFHDRIFGAMTTLRPRDEVEGSGMGLATASKIARHYGGNINIQSGDAPRGTTIEVRLPLSMNR